VGTQPVRKYLQQDRYNKRKIKKYKFDKTHAMNREKNKW
jgi:hypothetical protein